MKIDPSELKHIPLFRGLPPKGLQEAIDAFVPCSVGVNEVLLVEGEADRSMLVILDGELSVTVGDPPTRLAKVGKGEMLGEMALLGILDRRAATVSTLTPCRLLILDTSGMQMLRQKDHPLVASLEAGVLRTLASRLRETDRRISKLAIGTELHSGPSRGLFAKLAAAFSGRGAMPKDECPDPVAVLSSSVAFRELPRSATAALAQRLEQVPVAEGSRIIEEGVLGDDAWLVADGRVEVYRATASSLHERVAVLMSGTLFGLASLVDGQARSATCVAVEPSWLLRLPGELFQELVRSQDPEAKVLRRAMIEALSGQIRLANAHLESLTNARRAAGERVGGELAPSEVEAVKTARAAIESYQG